MNSNERLIRQQAAAAALKVQALDWINAHASKEPHPDSCPYMDDTGHPAPCSCGYFERNKITDFIRNAIIKA